MQLPVDIISNSKCIRLGVDSLVTGPNCIDKACPAGHDPAHECDIDARFGTARTGIGVLTILALLAGSLLLDALARPRAAQRPWLRSGAGMALLSAAAGLPLGLFMALGGNLHVSAGLALALVGLYTMVSNAKHAMLGEALVFSDLALLGAVFRHPQFYFSALTRAQKLLLAAAAPVVPLLLWFTREPGLALHLAGGLVFIGCVAAIALLMRLPPWSHLASLPDSEGDVLRHGLIPTIVLHWLRWRATVNPVPPAALPHRRTDDEVVIIVQCESFADPVHLFGDEGLALPGLEAARAVAWQQGRLQVHGFGAYTMRTEYGVLFGRSEAELGFRRFDPYLTATGEGPHALPARLASSGWKSLFLHPHDMRFYNRAEILMAAGFTELVGEERFEAPVEGEGRYVTDAAIASELLGIARAAAEPTLLYAVTIENHGPWADAESYLRLLRHGDAMLHDLMAELSAMKRPATIVFFGDHRPSIPGVTAPGGERHTPYVIVRFDAAGQPIRRSDRQDLPPAGLHHAVLNLLAGPASAPAP